MSKLSQRIRPNVEAPPWVCEEIKAIEVETEELKSQVEKLQTKLGMNMKNNRPTEIGLYMARAKSCTWWNYIIEIGGEPPYLKVNWALNRMDGTLYKNENLIEMLEFGEKIFEDNLNE